MEEFQNNHKTIITKLTIKEKPAYIKVIWENNENIVFSIQIFYEAFTWLGSFTCDAANKYRERHKETIDVYLKEVKKCLSKENPMYKYDFTIPCLTNDKNSATFSWKKLYEGSTAIIVHGSLELRQNIDSKDSLLDSLLQENQILKNNLENCIHENNKAKSELEKYRNEFENLINIKSVMEDTLYSKFAQLLNTKKRMIQVLQDALNNIENS